jgi:Ca2+/Na+ antiporter
MIHFLFICKILLLGLSIAQVLSTVQVYVSNAEYYTFLTAVQDTGYLAVPNEHVFSTLRNLGPAFCGGLFFTLTAGVALTIISSALSWAWDRLFSRNRIILLLLSILLLLCLLSANIQGFSPLITGHLLFIPVVVFRFTLKWLPKQPDQSHKNMIFPVITFLMLPLILIVWRPYDINEDRLLDVRDYLLLSNSVGRKVNAFYYENSLYSTRVIRSYGQQLLRSCRLEGMSDPSLTTRMTGILLARDYLPLGNAIRPDLRIALSDKDLEFYSQDELVLKSSMRYFIHNPAEPLKQFEKRTERPRFLLVFTMFSIFFLGALFLFACIYTPFYLISGFFLKSTPRSIKAGILWPVAFLLVFLALRAPDTESLSDPQNLSEAITSDHLHSRITALKYILRNKIDIAGFPGYHDMLNSQHIPERYWLAKALGGSRTPETQECLHQLLHDPHFNVVCMAVDSLGRRGNRADIPPILSKLETSHNWYEQWYAYRALRRLGWQQKESNEEQHM